MNGGPINGVRYYRDGALAVCVQVMECAALRGDALVLFIPFGAVDRRYARSLRTDTKASAL